MTEQFYDIVYKRKKYQEEVSFFLKSINYPKVDTSLHTVFEVGCGTGGHSLLLAKNFLQVYSIDLNPYMLDILKKKIKESEVKNIKVIQKNFLEISTQDIPKTLYGCAFFNVINYMLETTELDLFFRKVYGLLKKEGMFVFDCWEENKMEKSSLKTKNIYEEGSIEVTLSAAYDKDTRLVKTTETYHEIIKKETHSTHSIYKLWKKEELEKSIVKAGLSVAFIEPKVERREIWFKVIKK